MLDQHFTAWLWWCAGIGALIEHGAHVNARDNVGRTALHYACCLDEYAADVLSYLVSLGESRRTGRGAAFC